MTETVVALQDRVERSVAAAVDGLFAAQRPSGAWQDTLPSAAVSTASSIVALHLADPVGSAGLIEAGAAWLRASQNPDGGWGDAVGAPSNLSITPFAVGALHLVAPEASAENVLRGLERIERFGGMAAVADRRRCKLFVLCQLFLAMAGMYDETRIRRMPVEIILLPRKLRQKVSFVVPHLLSWGVMQAHTRRFGPLRRAVNRLAEPRAIAYLEEIEDFHGPGGGYQESPLMVSLVCLGLARAGVAPDIVGRCVDYLRGSVRPDGAWPVNRDLEFSATSFVTLGLQDAGRRDDPRLRPTLAWIRHCQRGTPFPATGCPGGGWGWSMPSGWPNTDDTADALLALAGFGVDGTDTQVRDGVAWLLRAQNRDGSWSCFCPDNHVDLDAPCSVMTAHAVTALRLAGGLEAGAPAIARAVSWFTKAQRGDGGVPCLWYRGLTAGTGCVLDALGGLRLAHTETARRCRDWLLAHQHPDGGWGDGERSASSVEETAWALLGLLGGGVPADHLAVQRGVAWLVDRQRADGLWEPTVLGVYFLDLMYSCDHLAAGYALQALARYHRMQG
jgi:squalene-hopene/tetraprenyl-beta-curcumene cyclase